MKAKRIAERKKGGRKAQAAKSSGTKKATAAEEQAALQLAYDAQFRHDDIFYPPSPQLMADRRENLLEKMRAHAAIKNQRPAKAAQQSAPPPTKLDDFVRNPPKKEGRKGQAAKSSGTTAAEKAQAQKDLAAVMRLAEEQTAAVRRRDWKALHKEDKKFIVAINQSLAEKAKKAQAKKSTPTPKQPATLDKLVKNAPKNAPKAVAANASSPMISDNNPKPKERDMRAKRSAEKKGKALTAKASKSSGKKAPSEAQLASRARFAEQARARAAEAKGGKKGAAKASANNAEAPPKKPKNLGGKGKKVAKAMRAQAVADAPKAAERMKKGKGRKKCPKRINIFEAGRKGKYDIWETGTILNKGKKNQVTVQANGKAELPIGELEKRRNSLDALIKARKLGKHIACPPTHP